MESDVMGDAVRTAGTVEGRDGALAVFRDEGCSLPRLWGNAPGDVYGWHAHDYHKVLFCLSGSIVFHTDSGDLQLRPGDRLDVEAGTRHAATVGAHGVECVEASR